MATAKRGVAKKSVKTTVIQTQPSLFHHGDLLRVTFLICGDFSYFSFRGGWFTHR